MPIWVSAMGIACIGLVCGYILFYSVKRHFPPTASGPLPVQQLIMLLGAVSAGGIIGGAFIALEGVNYIGAYGIGLAVGVAINVALTVRHEHSIMQTHGNSEP
jgi:dipeptide/tripeptide permease